MNYYDQPAEEDNLDATIGGAFEINPVRTVKREPVRVDSLAETTSPSDDSVCFLQESIIDREIYKKKLIELFCFI